MAKYKPGYKPLSTKDDLELEEEEEEELTIFDKKYDKKFGQGAYEENVELIFRTRKGRRQPRDITKSLLYNYTNNRILACFAVILVALLIAIVTGYALWMVSADSPAPTSSPSVPPPSVNQSTSVPPPTSSSYSTPPAISSTDTNTWRAEFHDGLSENSIHFSDINSDGIPDIITADVTTRFLNPAYDHCHDDDDNKCMDEFGHSPCQTRFLALDGNTGEVLWDTWVGYSAFAINCRNDFNSDGHPDCLFAGRSAGFSAYDIYNNRLLWIVDPSITCIAYNFYFPLITGKDFDKDGISDIIAIHGGDPRYDDLTKNRSPGFLIVISGATGRQLSEVILTPDNHESYSSPVLYTTRDHGQVVLFGSGGETISGSLWAVTLDSLADNVQRFIEKDKSSYTPNKEYKFPSCYTPAERDSLRPKIDRSAYSTSRHDDWMKNCPVLPGNNQPIWNKYKLCMYEFIPAGSAGTILPPVIVDMNRDGVMDLIVSQFNDHTLLYDGANGNIVWNHFERNTQTYSIPTLLYFNDDNILDVLVRVNKGRWMDYDYSFMSILDGNSGDTLWTFNCSIAMMSSPLVIRSKVKGHDAMVFLGAGCGGRNTQEGDDGKEGDKEGPEQGKGGEQGNNRHSRKRESEREKRNIKRISSHTCPRKLFDFQNNLFTNKHRKTRRETISLRDTTEKNDNQFFPANPEGSGSDNHHHNNDNDDQTNSPPPINDKVPDISQYVPNDLWTVRNKSDDYPNPWDSNEGLESFISDYCQLGPIDRWELSLYYATPQMIFEGDRKRKKREETEGGEEGVRKGPVPLDSFRPYVYKPSSSTKRFKRHGGGGGGESHTQSPPSGTDREFETIKSLLQNRKGLRCAHVMLPFMTAGTPAITDLNNDGKYEIVTSVMYSPLPGEYSRPIFSFLHVPKMIFESFNLDTRLADLGLQHLAKDTSSFYPLNKQPWTQYMGRDGNGIYTH